MLKLLLKHRSPVNATDSAGQTALHHAVAEGHGTFFFFLFFFLVLPPALLSWIKNCWVDVLMLISNSGGGHRAAKGGRRDG
jgi:hypothetical protein